MYAVSSNELVITGDLIRPENISLVGAKAVGLSSLPRSWVPKFFVITNKLTHRWDTRYSEERGNTVRYREILTNDEISIIADALRGLNAPTDGRVIVRSSSPGERIELRGTFISKVSEATIEEVLRSCDAVYQHASSDLVKKDFDPLNLALVVQVYVEPKAYGHLSNERRVARRRQEWLYEFEKGEKIPPVGRFALKYGKNRTIPVTTDELLAVNKKDLVSQLRSVAAYINNQGLRLHMEWVWDGQRLWIVQGDKDSEPRGRNPKSYFPTIRLSESTVTLKSFIHVDSVVHNQWHKIECLRDFKSVGLPTADLWVLEDASILSGLQNRYITSELKQDIEALISSRPIVIRTDIKPHVGLPPEMLQRSDCLSTSRSAEEFLVMESRSMLSKGVSASNFCFIVHHYVPSRSSAFCLAYPKRSRVRIDSIWGLPDGLMYYPHDSFELDPGDLGSVKKHIRFKDNYLAPSIGGDWIPVKAGKPWDWANSIKEEELVAIGQSSKQLADYINDCVQIMWFIEIPSNLGLPPLLPWWYRRGEPPLGVHEADPRIFTRDRILISTQGDLESLSSERSEDLEGIVLRIKPKPELLRDDDFLEAVANKAKEYNLPVELQGSVLQHAYYRLKHLGVRVQCVDLFIPALRAQQFLKLVRDHIPIRIKRGGERAYTITLTGDEMINVLKAKAVEEALELQSAKNVNDIEEELGDILEVILSLAGRIGLSMRELNRKVKIKRKERGSFQEGLILIETEEVPLIDIERSAYVAVGQGGKPRLPLPDTEGGVIPMTTRRIPKKQNGRIIIPLVPPDIREVALKVEDLGIVLKIKYEDKEIVIRWGREAPKVPREQLRLPLFE